MRYTPILFACLIFISCKESRRNKSHQQISDASVDSGEILAKKYCQSCHAFPDPGLLDVHSWERGVLPNMGPRLGIFNLNWNLYPSMRNDPFLPKGFYPSQALIKTEEWQDIINYYLAMAPDSLPAQQRKYPIRNDLQIFEVHQPVSTASNAATCLVELDTFHTPHSLLTADVFRKTVLRYDQNLQVVDSFYSSGPLVDLDFYEKQIICTDIGRLNPNNGKFGKLFQEIREDGNRLQADSAFHIDSLQRPVQSIRVDLNGDGKPDELICEFGHLTGALSWYENKGNNEYTRHVLRAQPGAIKAYVRDYNQDGLPDLLVLFAQGEEGIFLFTNKGQGRFEEKEILRFPPVYGSSYFELDDFNQDGFPDILYTCGDNADFSNVLKPYHGIYIFLNDGHWNFNQQYFFPIHGCYKAMARDFDGDGDLDICAISFFADYINQPEEGFVYLENQGGFNFIPHSLVTAQKGKWLTMNVGDLDGDGKPDIFLGNFSLSQGIRPAEKTLKMPSAFLFLKNISK